MKHGEVVTLADMIKPKNGNYPVVLYQDHSEAFRLTGLDFHAVLTRVESALKNIYNEIVIVHLDLDSPESVLYVPIVFGILGRGAFYFVSRREDIHDEAKRLGCRVTITTDPTQNNFCESKIIVDIQDTSPRRIPEDIVYVIKTLGSTGAAKTVHVTNASVTPDDVILLSSPPTFDPHIIDMFLAVASGATLLLRPRRLLTTGNVSLDTVTILQ